MAELIGPQNVKNIVVIGVKIGIKFFVLSL